MKNIYDSFNNVEIDLSEYEEVKIDDNEVNNIKNRVSKKLNKNNNKKKIYKPIAASIMGVLFVTTLINSDVVSASIDKVATTLKSYFEEKVDRDFSDYAVKIGDTITDNNISVTLNEFIVDNNLIMVNYNIDYSKLSEQQVVNNHVYITVNGKKITGGGGHQTKISDRVTNYVEVYTLDNLEINGPLDVDIKYEFYNTEPVEGKTYYTLVPIEGNWQYRFNINEEDVNNNLKTVKLTENNIINLYGDEIRITEVIKSDLTIRIKYEYLDYDKYKDINRNGGGEDKNPPRIEEKHRYNYGVFDENGDGFKMYTRSDRGTKGEVSYFINDQDLNKYTIVHLFGEIIVDYSE